MARRTNAGDLHGEIFDLMLEKVRNDAFPSATMLDQIEASLRPEDVEKYAEVLVEKVRSDPYPSQDHLARLRALT